jgi:hypothetical protein
VVRNSLLRKDEGHGLLSDEFLRMLYSSHHFYSLHLILQLNSLLFSSHLRAMKKRNYLKYLWEAVRAYTWILVNLNNCNINATT